MYELVSKFGILDICYRAGDLESYSGVLDFDYKKISNKISLRAAAQHFNKRAKDKNETTSSCQCNGQCNTKRCVCFNSNRKCNSHCHIKSHSNICCNKNN